MLKRIIVLQIATILLSAGIAQAQSSRRELYDSLLVGDRITPAVSSVMMPKTYTESILSSSLLSANTYYSSSGESLDMTNRATYSINTLQVTYGLTNSARLNLGLDLSYRLGRTDADPESSPWKVFGNSSEGLVNYERSFTSIGFRARYVPTKDRNFVIQNTFRVPFDRKSDESKYLGDNRFAFNTQFLYTYLLGRKFFLFGQMDALIRFKSDQDKADFTVPVNVYGTYLVNRHLFPFAQLGMLTSWGDVTRQSFVYGVGLQYQFNPMFNINALYSDVFAGKNTNRWMTYNLGVRVVF